jgi:DNA mismatch repair protein MutL
LRSEETESAHIQHYLTLAALAYPAIAVEFIKDGRMIWQLPAVKTEDKITALSERLRGLYGSEQKLLPANLTGQLPITSTDEETAGEELPVDPAIHIWGLIGAPGVSRSTRDEQHVFVNRRPVENRGINFAMLEGYHTALMKGRYPVCALFIELDASEVDVNIHPAKREVKFHHERAIRQIVAEAVRKALLDFHTPAPAPKPEPSKIVTSPALATLTLDPPATPGPQQAPADLPNFPKLSKPLPNWPAPAIEPLGSHRREEVDSLEAIQNSAPHVGGYAPAENRPHSTPVPLLHVPLRLVGVIGKLYVVLESDRGLVLLDQHAAHERILFEQMLQRLELQSSAPSQRLLLPETVELAARDANFLREQLSTLTRLGVGLSEFGERTFLLDALPPFVKVSDPRRFILELVDEMKAVGQGVNTLRLGEHVIAKTVCRHAVKANDALAGPELENLIEDLRHCQMPYTCPHGRPTIIEMNFKELEKKFGRTV